jgi:hypothetical protein
MTTYTVTASLKFPSSSNTGYQFTIHAKTAAEAIKAARGKVWDQGHTRQDGALSWRAEREVA